MGRRTGGHERAWIMDVCKRNGCKGKGWKWVEGTGALTCADGAGAREMLNRWGEAPVGISERGCQDVRGRCGCKGKVGNGLGEGPVGMSERGCADVCARCGCKENRLETCGGRTGGHERVDARTCADGVGARERLEMGGEKGRRARMCADSAGATEKLEMGREKERWA